MSTATLGILMTNGTSRQISATITETGGDHPNNYEAIPLLAGKAATDWVKTDGDTAACNLAGGHGYSSGKADVFWDGGMRYQVDMTVTVNALALDGGTGDDFPDSDNLTVVVCTPQQINTAIDGDLIKMLGINSTKRGSVYFKAGASAIKQIELGANAPYTYYASSGDASPLTGSPVTICWASNGTIEAGVIDILCLEDATP
jgi:hypothetical protein